MQTHTITTYSFDELSDDAKQKAIEKYYDINVHGEFWYEFTFDDAKTIGKLMGIDVDKIYFSGFSSQGDGACFDGSYEYAKGSVKAVQGYAPRDKVLHQIAKDLQSIQKPHFYELTARVKHRGRYYHEFCTNIDVGPNYPEHRGLTDEADDGVQKALRDFMRWIYRQLQAEYEYQTSEDAIKETLRVNGYEFTENGQIYQQGGGLSHD